MTNDMFTPPERRPVPAHLRARILAEVDAAVATSGQRPRRWLAPLIACGLAVAGVGGTLSLRESQHALPVAPATASALPYAQAQELRDRCAATARDDHGLTGDPVASPSGHTVLVGSSEGDRPTDRTLPAGSFVICAGDGNHVTAEAVPGQAGPDGVHVVTARLAGSTVLGVGGVVPQGVTRMTFAGSEPVSVSNGFWVADRVVPVDRLADQPDAAAVDWSEDAGTPPSGSSHRTGPVTGGAWTFPWPGGKRPAGPVGDALRASCEGMDRAPAQHVLTTRSGHARFEVSGDGQFFVCNGNGGVGGPADTNGVFVAASYAQWATGVDVLGGKLPAGVTAVRVRTPRGVQEAVVQEGYWVVEDLVPPSQTPMEPENLLVEMTGPKPRAFWTRWKESVDTVRAGYASSFEGFLTQDGLREECQVPKGSSALRSMGGHVLLTSDGDRAICAASKGFAYRFQPAQTPARDARTFALHRMTTDKGVVLLAGGGRLPAGVTGVTFVSPDGQVPATIKDGRWVHEQLMIHPTPGQTPTSVHLSGPGLELDVPLG